MLKRLLKELQRFFIVSNKPVADSNVVVRSKFLVFVRLLEMLDMEKKRLLKILNLVECNTQSVQCKGCSHRVFENSGAEVKSLVVLNG